MNNKIVYNVDKHFESLAKDAHKKYYGQWNTDEVIESYFETQRQGYCIEVGAADGVKGSNTKYFEDIGWTALCIEPNPAFQESLKTHRKHILQTACSNKNGTEQFCVFDVGSNNILSSISSLDPDDRLINDHKHIMNNTHKMDVQVNTLSQILIEHANKFQIPHDINFISIDTEGTELDVLQGFDFKNYNVFLFVIENNYNDNDIENYMITQGYKKHRRYIINDFYIKNNSNISNE